MIESLQSTLFPADGDHTYAVIDGASCGELLSKLDETAPDHVCLYAGTLEPDIEEVAPYLIELLPNHPFTGWLLDHFHGKHWGIFARSYVNLRALRKHFRTLLLVKSPQNELLYFRFYDPRVCSVFLPMTNAQERENIFGSVAAFFCETDEGELAIFRRRGTELDRWIALGAEVSGKA